MAESAAPLGAHFILDLYGCDEAILNDVAGIQEAFLYAGRVSNATVLTHSFHSFEPVGVTGVVVIAESHFSIHTWPEYDYAAIDIFTCGKDMKPEKAIEVFLKVFSAKTHWLRKISRGIFPVFACGFSE